MNRMGIIGEGITEENFVKKIISHHLLNFGIIVFSRQIVTKREAGQKDKKGGMPKYQLVKRDIQNLLSEDSNRLITSMFDLYALPKDFPGYEKACTLDPYSKVEYLEDSFKRDIDNPRFIPYIQLHEFETLIFSDVKIAHEILSLNQPKSSIKNLEKIIQETSNPELINGSASTAPSKRILSLYPDYQKSIDGIRILDRVGVEKICNSCRHFDEWMSKLESFSTISA